MQANWRRSKSISTIVCWSKPLWTMLLAWYWRALAFRCSGIARPPQYLTDELNIKRDLSVSNLKLGLGVLCCSFALFAQFFPRKFPDNYWVLLICCSRSVPVCVTRIVQHFHCLDVSLFCVCLRHFFCFSRFVHSSRPFRWLALMSLSSPHRQLLCGVVVSPVHCDLPLGGHIYFFW